MKKNRVKLNICSNVMTVSTEDDVEYIKKIADEVGQRISNIIDNASGHSLVNTIILVALQYCDEKYKTEQKLINLKEKNEKSFSNCMSDGRNAHNFNSDKNLNDELNRLKKDAALSIVEKEKLKSENFSLKKKLEALQESERKLKEENESLTSKLLETVAGNEKEKLDFDGLNKSLESALSDNQKLKNDIDKLENEMFELLELQDKQIKEIEKLKKE